MTDDVFTVPRQLAERDGSTATRSAPLWLAHLRAWWASHEDAEKTLRVGLAMLGVGFLLVWVPLALIVPGGILTFVAVVQALRGGAEE